jgi:pectinesterase
MKFYTLLSIFLIYIIQYTYSFPQNKLPKDAIIVAKDGSGNFKTVTEAINSLPNNASSERVIYIKNGTYYEYIVCQKKFVTMVGENRDKVILTYDLNNAKTGSSSKCATFRSYGDNFKAFDITFENTAPFPGVNTQAPAINCMAKNQYYENCRFLSYQDTLLSNTGTQYFKNCYIRGFTDFIWGSGRAVFDQCTIHVDSKGDIYRANAYLTANGNKDGNFKEGGFLITNSKVTTDGSSFYLGRLWKQNCYVIFDNTEFPGNKLVKEGWTTFSNTPQYSSTSRVGEHKCYGPNYNTYGRVSYANQFSSVPSIAEFLGGNISYIDDTFVKKGTATQKAVETKTLTTTTIKPIETSSADPNCNPLYYQCGGVNYKGSKCCRQGTCKKYNDYFSVCM